MSFGPDKLNGLALYRMLHHKRAILGIRGALNAVFIGRADYREDAEQDGAFLLRGSDPRAVVGAVRKQLKSNGAAPLRIAAGPIIWEGATSVATPTSPAAMTDFTPRTDQLLRDARSAIARAVAVQKWRMPIRRPFEIRVG